MVYIEKKVDGDLVDKTRTLINNGHIDQLRPIIKEIYLHRCAYCESPVGASSFGHIDHFYPKSNREYSIYENDIRNWHYCCQICNTWKGWVVPLNILTPNYFLYDNTWQLCEPNSVEGQLYYKGHLLFAKNSGTEPNKAQATIDLFDLNNENNKKRSGRRELIEARIRAFSSFFFSINHLYELIESLAKDFSNSTKMMIKRQITEVVRKFNDESEYSTMIAHNFGCETLKLLEIFAVFLNHD